jgi:hypothetical protein
VSLLSKMDASVGIDDEGRVSGLVAHAIAAKGRHRETSAVGRLDQNLAIMLKDQTAAQRAKAKAELDSDSELICHLFCCIFI